MKNIPFGSPAALIARNAALTAKNPTVQSIAIVVCGGGNPMAEFGQTQDMVAGLDLPYVTLVGNDQIGRFPYHVDHAVTLHPDKLAGWQGLRRANGFEEIRHYWAHRNYSNVTNWTRDWSGSTGLMCAKIARELGHTHVVLCGVPMTVEAKHFVRNQNWDACWGFRRGWTNHLTELKPYLRSWSGWTKEIFGEPTTEWMERVIADEHRLDAPQTGLKA